MEFYTINIKKILSFYHDPLNIEAINHLKQFVKLFNTKFTITLKNLKQ